MSTSIKHSCYLAIDCLWYLFHVGNLPPSLLLHNCFNSDTVSVIFADWYKFLCLTIDSNITGLYHVPHINKDNILPCSQLYDRLGCLFMIYVCDFRRTWWRNMSSGSWAWSQRWGRGMSLCRSSTSSCTTKTCSTCSSTLALTNTVSSFVHSGTISGHVLLDKLRKSKSSHSKDI